MRYRHSKRRAWYIRTTIFTKHRSRNDTEAWPTSRWSTTALLHAVSHLKRWNWIIPRMQKKAEITWIQGMKKNETIFATNQYTSEWNALFMILLQGGTAQRRNCWINRKQKKERSVKSIWWESFDIISKLLIFLTKCEMRTKACGISHAS